MKNVGTKLIFGLSLTAMIAGCGKSAPTFSLLPDSQSFTQSSVLVNNRLDILFVVDNSGSMSPFQTNLTSNFQSFISNFVTKGYDFKIAVTTSEAYKADPTLNGYSAANSSLGAFRNASGFSVLLPTTPNITSTDPTKNPFVLNANVGSSGSGDERVFSSFREAINYPGNAGFIRSNSFVAVVILSDEDDFSGNGRCENCGTGHNYSAATLDPVSTYSTFLDTATNYVSTGVRRYNVSSIAVLDSTCKQNHANGTGGVPGPSPSTIIGQRYIQLTNATNGVLGSICDASYATALNSIQAKISELSTEFILNRVPQVNTIVVQVNGVNVPQDPNNGWTYDATNNGIVFHGSAVPPQGASVSINFVPETIK